MKNKDLIKLYAAYKSGCMGNNILDTYFNFLANIILEAKMTTVNETEVASKFRKKYQIDLPLSFVRQVLGIGLSNGSIIDERGVYLVKKDILAQYKFEATDFDDMWSKLINSFNEYCTLNDIGVVKSDLEPQILTAIDNTDEIILSSDKINSSEGMNEFDYAWYSFVKENAEKGNELFDFVTALCASNITKQALFYSGAEGEEYKGLNVYLDSPMVFALLGLDSPERESSYKILIDNMKAAGCVIQVLDHNFQEIEGIVTRAAGWAVSTQYDIRKANNVARFFHDSKMEEQEITDFCGSLEMKLNDLGIVIKSTEYDVYQNQFQEDEATLYNMIQDKYTDQQLALLPEKAESIKVDVRSIVMIYRERRGQVAVKVGECKHIMLTTNNAIANVCKKYESNKSIQSGHIPACISADLFGAILWLSSPVEMMNYQRKKLLADCYDFLRPSKSLIEKYVASLENARHLGEIDEKKYLFMRTHPIVLDTLMNITHGDYARFNDRTYLEVYDTIVAQSEKKYEEEAAAHADTKEKLLIETKEKDELKQRIGEIESERFRETHELTEKIEALTKEVREGKKREMERREKEINRKSSIWGNILAVLMFGIPYIILLAVSEILKGKYSELSWISVVYVSVLLVGALCVGILYNKGKQACINFVKKKLVDKDN